MTISLTNTGKRFNREWVFRHINHTFLPGIHYAITGPNGSGKSTLLQVIGGAVSSSEGKLSYSLRNAVMQPEAVFREMSIAAPYLELIEEMTLLEFLRFHHQFKPLRKELDLHTAIATVGLERATNKQIRFFSSGMKQRVKLAQAIFSDTALLLLDEPCTNLDAEGISLYQQLIKQYGNERLIIVSSNDKVEYEFCQEQIDMRDFK